MPGAHRACVAAGHPATVAAAQEALRAGGNAVDACIAGGFAAAVSEPCLTGLGGGGFLLAHLSSNGGTGDDVLVDFFVDTPGVGLEQPLAPEMTCVTVQFPGSAQDFHVGGGSIAVPGCLPGYLHAHRRFGRLDLDALVAPAVRLAREGVVLNEWQGYLFGLLEAILTFTPHAAEIFAPGGRLLGVGDRYANDELATFLDELDERGFAAPAVAQHVVDAVRAGGGLLTGDDLASFDVIEREPVVVDYRGTTVLTNPPPSLGGTLIALGLARYAQLGEPAGWGSEAHAVGLVDAMVDMDLARVAGDALARLQSIRGTTHISVADAEGNVASMTTSNGEGAGIVAPGTGVLLNNMLGEDDLHPAGFHAAPAGERVASMMAPTIVLGADGKPLVAAGTGGSARIRTALLQLVAGVVDEPDRSLRELVERPRLHWDGSIVQVEPGFPASIVSSLAARWSTNEWTERNLYFGGIHAVRPGSEAAGDPRRGGAAAVLPVLDA